MHYNAIFLAIFTLVAAGTVSVSASALFKSRSSESGSQKVQCIEVGHKCVGRVGRPCCPPEKGEYDDFNYYSMYVCVFSGIHSYYYVILPLLASCDARSDWTCTVVPVPQ